MTLAQRIGKILSALFSFLCAWIMFRMGEAGFLLVSLMISISLILFGLRSLIFYWTMARHMVDGRTALYIGVIVLDFGFFTLSVTQYHRLFIAIYLLAVYAFSGAMDILRALEARRLEAPSWRLNLAVGIVNIGVAVAAAYFGLLCGDMRDLTLIYAAGMVYTAVLSMISAFRKTAIVYIP